MYKLSNKYSFKNFKEVGLLVPEDDSLPLIEVESKELKLIELLVDGAIMKNLVNFLKSEGYKMDDEDMAELDSFIKRLLDKKVIYFVSD